MTDLADLANAKHNLPAKLDSTAQAQLSQIHTAKNNVLGKITGLYIGQFLLANAVDIFGAKLGAFSRDDRLTTEDFEMLVVAEKS